MSRPSRNSAIFYGLPASQRGFTLVELLVVILILAILMAVALPLYLSAVRTSTRRTARENMKTLTTAMAAYRMQKDHFTEAQGDLIGAEIISGELRGPGTTTYTLHIGPASLPGGRSINTGQIAVCGSDSSVGANGDYGCYIPGEDTD